MPRVPLAPLGPSPPPDRPSTRAGAEITATHQAATTPPAHHALGRLPARREPAADAVLAQPGDRADRGGRAADHEPGVLLERGRGDHPHQLVPCTCLLIAVFVPIVFIVSPIRKRAGAAARAAAGRAVVSTSCCCWR
ncbi:hypothetical protein QJS66_19245 [Kocuria rhizophila]|nr:hypothetical protein QJS66_19245 [Kocuria rhizophila]